MSALVSGPEAATLAFDLRNDAPPYSPDWTESWVYFREEADPFLVHFEASGGWDSSHWRDVRLQIGTTLLRDQYGPYNDHLGTPAVGTAGQSVGGEAWTILGQTGFAASTYVLRAPAAVPEPSRLLSAALGLPGLAGYAGWRRTRLRRAT